jgi:hypothetical protein
LVSFFWVDSTGRKILLADFQAFLSVCSALKGGLFFKTTGLARVPVLASERNAGP